MGKARNAMGILLHPVGLLTNHLHFSLYSWYRTYDCKLFSFGSGEEYCGKDLGKYINEKSQEALVSYIILCECLRQFLKNS